MDVKKDGEEIPCKAVKSDDGEELGKKVNRYGKKLRASKKIK